MSFFYSESVLIYVWVVGLLSKTVNLLIILLKQCKCIRCIGTCNYSINLPIHVGIMKL